MNATAVALKSFFGGFGIPAYTKDTVPDDVAVPYIAYYFQEPEWDKKTSGYAQIWYRTKSNSTVLAKADEVMSAIGLGKRIDLNGYGYLVIYNENPSGDIMVDPDDDAYRAAIVNFSINSYHMPGV